MRRLGLFACVCLAVAACGGSTTATQPPAGQTARPIASSAPAATSAVVPATPGAPAGGAATVTVVLSGGSNPGTYTGTDDPNCSDGLVPGSWGVQFSIDSAAPNQLGSLQVIAPKDPASASQMTLLVTLGPILNGTNFSIDPVSGGSGSVQVNDQGATAVIHATGTTKDGVQVDATVNCPSVIRATQ